MGALLDTVTLNEWRNVVEGKLHAAKNGDAQASNWLAHTLSADRKARRRLP